MTRRETPTPQQRIASLKNLGPKSAERIVAAGITDSDALCRIGAAAAYHKVKSKFPKDTSLNLLWAIQGALMGIHWHNIQDDLKQHLLTELEDISKTDHSDSKRS